MAQDQNPNEKYGIPTNMNHQLIQQALQSQNVASSQQQQAANTAIDRIEGSMYDTLGSQQLQNERDISQRRLQALRSGTTSSGLAALELQNIQTAALGAQEMSRQYDQQRAQLMTETAGAQASNAGYMAQMVNQNLNSTAAVDAQRLPHDWGQAIQSLYGEEAVSNASPKQLTELKKLFDPAVDNDEVDMDAINEWFGTLPATPKEEQEEEENREPEAVKKARENRYTWQPK